MMQAAAAAGGVAATGAGGVVGGGGGGGGGGAGTLSSPQSSMSLGGNSRTNTTNPIQNSLTTGGGLVMTASGHGYQHSFQVAQGGSDSSSLRGSLSSPSGGVNRIRAPISHIPSGNPPAFQEVRTMPRLNALSQSTNKALLHQGKQSLNSGAGTPRPHSQQVT